MLSALVAHLLWGTATFRRKKTLLINGRVVYYSIHCFSIQQNQVSYQVGCVRNRRHEESLLGGLQLGSVRRLDLFGVAPRATFTAFDPDRKTVAWNLWWLQPCPSDLPDRWLHGILSQRFGFGEVKSTADTHADHVQSRLGRHNRPDHGRSFECAVHHHVGSLDSGGDCPIPVLCPGDLGSEVLPVDVAQIHNVHPQLSVWSFIRAVGVLLLLECYQTNFLHEADHAQCPQRHLQPRNCFDVLHFALCSDISQTLRPYDISKEKSDRRWIQKAKLIVRSGFLCTNWNYNIIHKRICVAYFLKTILYIFCLFVKQHQLRQWLANS